MSDDVDIPEQGEDPGAPIPFAAADGGAGARRGRRRPAAASPAAQAPAAARPDRPRRARVHLDGVRDDDGGRLRLPQIENEPSTSRSGQLLPVRRPGAADRALRPAEQRRDRLASTRSRRGRCRTRSSRSRTSGSGPIPASTSAASPARSSPTSPAARRQGASTIAQQFVKNALSEENNRTMLEKLREAALAYHLTREWPKQKILDEYLNSIYFGNGAYGIESAARVYFGKEHGYDPAATPTRPYADGATPARSGCGDATAAQVRVGAGAVGVRAARRDGRLPDRLRSGRCTRKRRQGPPQPGAQDMSQQGYISRAAVPECGINKPLPTAGDIQQPSGADAGAVLHELAAPPDPRRDGPRPRRAGPDRRVPRVLRRPEDPDHARPQAAGGRRAGDRRRAPDGEGLPSASLVAIDNKTGEVRAMVGGPIVNGSEDFDQHPFNLATEGHRQPGSAFKPFTLSVALESGFTARLGLRPRRRPNFIVPNSAGKEHFIVHNFGNTYSGPTRSPRRPPSPTTRCTRGSGSRASARPDQADRPAGQDDGDPLAGVEQLRDDPRRAQGGRHAARHGARL